METAMLIMVTVVLNVFFFGYMLLEIKEVHYKLNHEVIDLVFLLKDAQKETMKDKFLFFGIVLVFNCAIFFENGFFISSGKLIVFGIITGTQFVLLLIYLVFKKACERRPR